MSPRAPFLLLAGGLLAGCSFDVDRFSPALSGDDAGDDVSVDAGADGPAKDTGATKSDTGAATDTGAAGDTGAATDTGVDAPTCSGTKDVCFACCKAAFPKGASAVTDVAGTCLCAACATACDKTFCKPGARKDPDLACAECLGPATSTSCAANVASASGAEPQASSFGACVSACK